MPERLLSEVRTGSDFSNARFVSYILPVFRNTAEDFIYDGTDATMAVRHFPANTRRRRRYFVMVANKNVLLLISAFYGTLLGKHPRWQESWRSTINMRDEDPRPRNIGSNLAMTLQKCLCTEQLREANLGL